MSFLCWCVGMICLGPVPSKLHLAEVVKPMQWGEYSAAYRVLCLSACGVVASSVQWHARRFRSSELRSRRGRLRVKPCRHVVHTFVSAVRCPSVNHCPHSRLASLRVASACRYVCLARHLRCTRSICASDAALSTIPASRLSSAVGCMRRFRMPALLWRSAACRLAVGRRAPPTLSVLMDETEAAIHPLLGHARLSSARLPSGPSFLSFSKANAGADAAHSMRLGTKRSDAIRFTCKK